MEARAEVVRVARSRSRGKIRDSSHGLVGGCVYVRFFTVGMVAQWQRVGRVFSGGK